MHAYDPRREVFFSILFCSAIFTLRALSASDPGDRPTHGAHDSSEEWTYLFESGDFSQWTKVDGTPVGPRWTINDGVIHRSGLVAGDIITRAHYRDFVLEFEWKISKAGNSGVKYRTRGRLGLEYQILDDAQHRDARTPSHRTASLYNLAAIDQDRKLNPAGEWNSGRIVLKDRHIEHWLNGRRVLSISIGSEDWSKRLDASKYRNHRDFGTWTGPILLQDHFDEVWYRNVRIRML